MAKETPPKTTVLWCLCLLVTSIQLAEAETGQFWHVTDFHFDQTYGAAGLSCNERVNMTGKYGDYWCDSPWALVKDSIESMASIYPNPDFILWTGDTVGHIDDEHMSIALNVEVLKNITDHLTGAFPNVTVFTSLGNHDFWPSDHAQAHEDDYYDRVADIWAPLIGDDNQTDLFRKGGYYYRDLTDKIRILCLNTNLYYFPNPLTRNLSDPADQFHWMREILTDAREKGMNVMMTGHVSPGLLTPDLTDWMYPHFRNTIMEIVTSFSDVIIVSHFGHDHTDGFRILQREDGTNGVPNFCAPSVTPWRFKIPGKTGVPHNPGVRLVTYDRESGLNLDYQQYYINLTDSNAARATNWTVLYTFTEAYDVPDMSVQSVKKAIDRTKMLDSEYALKFCQFSVLSGQPTGCSRELQASIYCGGVHSWMDSARDCERDLLASAAAARSVSARDGALMASVVALLIGN